jgi:hypothetical protein
MYVIQDVLVSDDIFSEEFVCNLSKCKGACCVEGDFGAPLEDEEIAIIENFYPQIEPYIDDAGKEAIKEAGVWAWFDKDDDNFKGTTLRKDLSCAFIHTDPIGIVSCGIEKAYLDGKIDFKKPISCHLYPIRYSEIKETEFRALNYDIWSVCNPACALGKELKVPLVEFLKEAIIRKFDESFYEELNAARIDSQTRNKED